MSSNSISTRFKKFVRSGSDPSPAPSIPIDVDSISVILKEITLVVR
jgi:hypothetical protein